MRPNTLVIPLCLVLTYPAAVQAQDAESRVLEVIQVLFDGMRTADTLGVRSTFHPEARLVATDSRAGRSGSSITPVDSFIAAVGGSGGGWDERIWGPEVRIDDDVAMVWAKYDFHVGDRFSHCGVDVFNLLKTPEGWKFISIVYTRRAETCESPPSNDGGGQ